MDQENALVDISHVSGLENLSVSAGSLAVGSALPSGLTSLMVSGAPLGSESISNLDCLQRLQLKGIRSSQSHGFMECLARLPQLRHVTCGYSHCGRLGWEAAVVSAPTWQKLPLLRELGISYVDSGRAPEQKVAEAAAVGQGLAAATSLTKLAFNKVPAANMCCYVRCLPQLADLVIYAGSFPRDDAFLLKGLTQLTSLKLQYCPAVDDAVAVALVSNMPRLQQLGLDCCAMKSDAWLPQLEGLHGLRSLCLQQSEWLKDESMPLLAGLTQLMELWIHRNPQLSEASGEFLKQALPKCRVVM